VTRVEIPDRNLTTGRKKGWNLATASGPPETLWSFLPPPSLFGLCLGRLNRSDLGLL